MRPGVWFFFVAAVGGLALEEGYAQAAKPHYFERAVALCIGIDKYRFVPEARFAENDARAIGASLAERYGFEAQYLIGAEATKGNIEKKLDELTAQLGERDVLILFFAGHGQVINVVERQNTSTREGFLVPYAARVQLENHADPAAWRRETLDMSDLIRRIVAMKAQHVLVLADACCSGFMAQRGGAVRARADLQFLLNQRSRAVMTATTDNQVATPDGNRQHGQFTAALLDELQALHEQKEAASLLDLFENVRFQVSAAKQASMMPMMNSHLDASDGEFVFLPKSISPTDIAYIQQLAARLKANPAAAGDRGVLAAVFDRARERENLKTTEAQVIEAFECFHYRFRSDAAAQEQTWRGRFQQFYNNATVGDVNAMAGLHYCYSRGLGTAENPELAYRWAREAYESKLPVGKHVMGRALINGYGVTKNAEAGWKLIDEAAQAGFAISMTSVAKQLRQKPNASITKAEVAQAVAYYERAAAQGVQSAKTNHAMLLLGHVPASPQNVPKALELLESAAAADYPEAHYGLACVYIEKQPGYPPQNVEKARHSLIKAAEGGMSDAQHNLACAYYQSRGIVSEYGLPQDFEKAVRWLELAAAQNMARSKMLLSILYEEGEGVEKDYAKAQKYCEEAAAANWPPAMFRQAQWYLIGKIYKKDLLASLRCAQNAASLGSPDGCRLTGALLEDGVDLPAGTELIRELQLHHGLNWYVKAMQAGGDDFSKKQLEKFAKEVRGERNLIKIGIPLGNPIGCNQFDILNRFEQQYPDSYKAFLKDFLPEDLPK